MKYHPGGDDYHGRSKTIPPDLQILQELSMPIAGSIPCHFRQLTNIPWKSKTKEGFFDDPSQNFLTAIGRSIADLDFPYMCMVDGEVYVILS